MNQQQTIITLSLITIAGAACGPVASRFPSRDKISQHQQEGGPSGPHYVDQPIQAKQLEGKWLAVLDAPILGVDKLSTEGSWSLTIDLKKKTFEQVANFLKEKEDKKESTIEISEAGKVTFQAQQDLLYFDADPALAASMTTVKSDEMAKALNEAAYCGWKHWKKERAVFADYTSCKGTFPSSQWVHVASVSDTTMKLSYCTEFGTLKELHQECHDFTFEKSR